MFWIAVVETSKSSGPARNFEITLIYDGGTIMAVKILIRRKVKLQSLVFVNERTQLAELAVKSRLPAIYDRWEFVDDGGLICYGTNFTDLSHRAATYVDKILKGAKPADLPVEQPTKFELVINLKAAKRIGLTIPPNVLGRADKVIKWQKTTKRRC
jgi:ABC transporter substrate binding protein